MSNSSSNIVFGTRNKNYTSIDNVRKYLDFTCLYYRKAFIRYSLIIMYKDNGYNTELKRDIKEHADLSRPGN